MSLELAPLRERPDDVPLLAEHFARRWALTYGRPVPVMSPDALERLTEHPWPGNVRELENVIHRAVIEVEGPTIEWRHLKLDPIAASSMAEPLAGRSWNAVQKDLIFSTLAQVDGNRRKAAQLLGMGERTLRNRLREYRMAGQATARA
jgi:two-component system response regulator FlrC